MLWSLLTIPSCVSIDLLFRFRTSHLDVFPSSTDVLDWKFTKPATSSSVPTFLSCNGLNIVQTPASGNALTKTYKNLGSHQFIRIVATVHFVDDWQGETAYLKVNGQYVWTDAHDQRASASQISICGRSQYPESKFTSNVDVTLPHTTDELTIEFGSNMEAGNEAVFGISSIQIQTRLA